MFNATHERKDAMHMHTRPCWLVDHNGFRYPAVYNLKHGFFAYVRGGLTRHVDAPTGAPLGFRVEWN